MIFVRHNDSTDPDFSPNSTGWEIISELAPLRNEKIIDKIYNSAFHDTELHVYLKNKNISSIILAGMQTEYCMDASCKTAFDLGYQITIPLECHATFSNDLCSASTIRELFANRIWSNRFANVCSTRDLLKK